MTGRLPVRTGLIRPILAGDTISRNPWEGEVSIGRVLSDAGYHTVLTGKWHTAEKVGLAPWLFNLYIDPKEQMPVGHRLNAWLASMGAEAKAHAATFKKYPPKNIGLAQ